MAQENSLEHHSLYIFQARCGTPHVWSYKDLFQTRMHTNLTPPPNSCLPHHVFLAFHASIALCLPHFPAPIPSQSILSLQINRSLCEINVLFHANKYIPMPAALCWFDSSSIGKHTNSTDIRCGSCFHSCYVAQHIRIERFLESYLTWQFSFYLIFL